MLNRVFGNRYRLVEKVGIGGMAEVYKATDEVLGRTVAVKVMLPQYAADPSFAARFRQEAQAAANLQSPYIVNIYDWGQDDGTYFIAMEFVRGTDLKTAIEQRGSIGQRKVAEIGSQVCAALSVAHGYDIIHRDIKPHNIMVQPDGNAKVMDFGIARAGNSSMTQTGSVMGTAYYVSPEQAQGKPLTPATDIYSLGVVLYKPTGEYHSMLRMLSLSPLNRSTRYLCHHGRSIQISTRLSRISSSGRCRRIRQTDMPQPTRCASL